MSQRLIQVIYSIDYVEERLPENFTVQELEAVSQFLFHELLELVDLNLHAADGKAGCPQFHVFPRFVRDLPDCGKEILSMSQILQYFLLQNQPVIDETELGYLLKLPQVNCHKSNYHKALTNFLNSMNGKPTLTK